MISFSSGKWDNQYKNFVFFTIIVLLLFGNSCFTMRVFWIISGMASDDGDETMATTYTHTYIYIYIYYLKNKN